MKEERVADVMTAQAERPTPSRTANDENALPKGWLRTTLSEVCAINPGIDKTSFHDDDELAFVSMPAIEAASGKINVTERRLFKNVKTGFTAFASNDILFAKITPCMENGKMAIVPDIPKGAGFGSTEFHVLRATKAVKNKFLYYFVSSEQTRHEAQHKMTGAVGQKRVPKRYLETKELPLPPLNEQLRIVEKIDTLFAELDQGEAALEHTLTLLKRYRQSLLKAAITGELTRDWRAARTDDTETGTDLLNRILTARHEHWEAEQRAKFEAKGKIPKTDAWKNKYKPPTAPDTTNLPELPKGWVWAAIEQLAANTSHSLAIGPFGSNLKVTDYRDNGVPLVFVRNIRAQNFDGLSPKFVSEEKAKELSAHAAYPGDLLITKMGDPPGDVCIYPSEKPKAIITADCIRFAAAIDKIASEFLEIAISSDIVQIQIGKISKGVAQKKMTLAGFKRISIPLPPYEEQKVIAERINEALGAKDQLETHCQTELARSKALRQSILKDAFAGKFVPQDPSDEPASDLLARIRAERNNP